MLLRHCMSVSVSEGLTTLHPWSKLHVLVYYLTWIQLFDITRLPRLFYQVNCVVSWKIGLLVSSFSSVFCNRSYRFQCNHSSHFNLEVQLFSIMEIGHEIYTLNALKYILSAEILNKGCQWWFLPLLAKNHDGQKGQTPGPKHGYHKFLSSLWLAETA